MEEREKVSSKSSAGKAEKIRVRTRFSNRASARQSRNLEDGGNNAFVRQGSFQAFKDAKLSRVFGNSKTALERHRAQNIERQKSKREQARKKKRR